MRRLYRSILVGALVVVGGLGASPQGQVPARSTSPRALWEVLNLYAAGQFEAAVGRAMRLGFDPVQADAWIANGPRTSQEQRRMVAAVCALDLAARRPFLLPRLAPWARTLWGAGDAGPWESIWLRASVAVAEGFGLWTFLLEDGPEPSPLPPARRGAPAPPPKPRPVAHLRFARQRLGDDPYVAMAEVVGAEFVTSPAIVGAASRVRGRQPGSDKLGGDLVDREVLERAGAVTLLEAAAATAERLTVVSPLSAEAFVRLGYLRLRLGDTDAALRNFDQASERTTSRDLRYLARLYTGLTLDRLNRVEEAAASYRAALDLVPQARSATTLLVALLVRAGRLEESEGVATAFIEAGQAADDPWRDYFLGDYPSAQDLIARLRTAVK